MTELYVLVSLALLSGSGEPPRTVQIPIGQPQSLGRCLADAIDYNRLLGEAKYSCDRADLLERDSR